MNRIVSFLLGLVVGAGLTVLVFLFALPFIQNFLAARSGSGDAAGAQEIALEKQTPISGYGDILVKKKATFQVLEKEYTPHNRLQRVERPAAEEAEAEAAAEDEAAEPVMEFNCTYPLASRYSLLQGTLVPFGYSLGEKGNVTLTFYDVDPHGTEKILQKYTASIGDAPAEISLDVSGVDYLRIYTEDEHCAFYDIYLVEKAA